MGVCERSLPVVVLTPSEAREKDLTLSPCLVASGCDRELDDDASGARHRDIGAMTQFAVYILASKSRCLYIGVTNDLARRLSVHRAGLVSFTSRYRVTRLVYVEFTTDVRAALRREKQLKGWRRARKVALIEAANPDWSDLAEQGQ